MPTDEPMPGRERFFGCISFLALAISLAPAILANADPGLEGVNDATRAPDPAAREEALKMLPATGLLLIPDEDNDRVMAFDPLTGDVVDPDFIPADPANLSLPSEAVLSPDGLSILVVDLFSDVVQQYDLMGTFLGTFAPAGGADTSILSNSNGVEFTAAGNLLATVAADANQDAVAEFDAGGNFIGNFVSNGSAGLDLPVDVFEVPTSAGILQAGDFLVSAAAPGTAGIYHYDAFGAPVGAGFFAPIDALPAQIAQAANGNILVANNSGPQKGIHELTPAGGLVGIYDPLPGRYRGVYELPNGNILTTSMDGVHEIDRLGNLVETKLSGVNARLITLAVTVVGPGILEIPTASDLGLLVFGLLLAMGSVIALRTGPGRV